VAGAAERGAIGAVVGAILGALDGQTLTGRILNAAYWASIGFSAFAWQPQPSLRSVDRKDRATLRRCVRVGEAPDDPRLAPGVVALAAPISEPLPQERFAIWLYGTWVGVLAVLTVLGAIEGDDERAAWAAINLAIAAFLCFAFSYRRRVIRPRATRCLRASLALLQEPTT
jgi:hypothetical protein